MSRGWFAPACIPQTLELEPILVVGERPGPALWKVTWKDHTLWILPTLSPLPRQVIWRSRPVEEALRQSQEVFFEASLDIAHRRQRQGGRGGWPSTSNEAPTANGCAMYCLPDLACAEFAALMLNATPAAGAWLEMYRPFYASLELRKLALPRQPQLDSDGQVHDQVAYLAHASTACRYACWDARSVRDPPRWRQTSRRTPWAADTECARSQLLQLERELRDAALRANAWSTGDIEALRADWAGSRRQDQMASCQALFQQLAPTARAVRETRDRGYTTLAPGTAPEPLDCGAGAAGGSVRSRWRGGPVSLSGIPGRGALKRGGRRRGRTYNAARRSSEVRAGTHGPRHIFKIMFVNQGKAYEIYARKVSHGALFGFIEVEELVYRERSTVVAGSHRRAHQERVRWGQAHLSAHASGAAHRRGEKAGREQDHGPRWRQRHAVSGAASTRLRRVRPPWTSPKK